MFSLGDGTKFWLYRKPTDMRKNFNMLSVIVNNDMRQNLYSGDVFVFVLFSAMGHPFQQLAEMILRSSVTSGSSLV